MAYRLAKSLEKLRSQINGAYPGRDKESDGWIGDAAHKSRSSDHNPWVTDSKGVGVVTATDTDEDLSASVHSIEHIISAIRKSRDPRVKYIIYEGRITRKGSDLQQWDPYHGTNPHKHHAHISVKSEAKFYDDDHDWNIGSSATDQPAAAKKPVPAPSVTTEILKRGATGQDVRTVQRRLEYLKYRVKVDGDYGLETYNAVVQFQRDKKLYVDGRVGPETRRALKL